MAAASVGRGNCEIIWEIGPPKAAPLAGLLAAPPLTAGLTKGKFMEAGKKFVKVLILKGLLACISSQ